MKTPKFILIFSALLLLSPFSGCMEDKKEKVSDEAGPISEDTTLISKDSDEEQETGDLIQVTFPRPGAEITSPLQIRGKARGTWYFEGDFPVRLFDAQGNEIAIAIATAQGEWMTEDWVDFEATMEFEVPTSGDGVLVFQKSNPSDMRELDREYRMEVGF